MLQILKVNLVAFHNFFFIVNPVEYRDQDHDFTLDYNTKTTFYIYIEYTHQILVGCPNSYYCASRRDTQRPNVQTDRRTDGRTDGQIFFACFEF